MQNLIRVESLLVMVVIFALLVYIHVNDEKSRPYTFALLPGVFANIVFYAASVLWRFGFIDLAVGFLSDLSNYRVQAVAVPALIVLISKARALWTGRK